jgi:fermentation-respiration switch protein FrsA (DUF1100 family)
MKHLSVKISVKRILLRSLRALLIFYAVLFVMQRYLVFPAYMADIILGKLQTPIDYGLADFAEVYFDAEDGMPIMGWSHPPENNMPVILYLHGNAMHIAGHAQRYQAFAEAGYGVLALSWRGYGKSEGWPSEEGFYRDARAAIAWLKQAYKTPKIIIYGESIGSGVAVEMAKEQPVFGIVLQGAYTSVADVAAQTYWFLPGIHYLVRDPLESLSKIAEIHSPILIIHGDRDDLIPIAHGKKLAAAATSRTQFITVPNAGHVDIPDQLVIKAMLDFFQE